MQSKAKVLIIIVIVLAILGYIVNLYISAFGNPITSMRIKNAANTYVEENYADLNLEFIEAQYDTKFAHYDFKYQSKDNAEITLSVYVNGEAKVLRDNLKMPEDNEK